MLLIILRRVNNERTALPSQFQHLETLANLLFKLHAMESNQYDEECAKYLLLTEEILISLHLEGFFHS
jgi:hypothetical protein